MRKILICLRLVLVSALATAQNGLENIIVERYYESDVNDSIANDNNGVSVGALPVGSVTYRIYADMLPGYKFQAGYGVPGHELRIATTTWFFNNEDRGATTPTYSKTNARNNTVMLDSWLSVGAACTGNYGILKSLDDGVATVVNADGVLQNNAASAGIPLTVQDGLIAGTPEMVTDVGITNEIAMFGDQNDGTNGPVFSTSNGSWASLNGSMGPDTVDNKVLIAQITTDGELCFELNIQIGTPTHGVENYVAQNPVGAEIQMGALTYCSTVGVKNPVAASPLFKVYPNPSKDFFTLAIDAAGQSKNNCYTIYDAMGSMIARKELGEISGRYSEKVDMSSFAKGLYLVELYADGGVSTKKIFVN